MPILPAPKSSISEAIFPALKAGEIEARLGRHCPFPHHIAIERISLDWTTEVVLIRAKESKMSGVSLPVTRPTGRSLLVGTPAARVSAAAILGRLGWTCIEMDDPYAAMAALSAAPRTFSSLILSLSGLFGDELEMISVVKRRYPQIEIWLSRAEGLDGILNEAMRLGADGILGSDGPHRIPSPSGSTQPIAPPAEESRSEPQEEEMPLNETVLSADELRALLDDFPPERTA